MSAPIIAVLVATAAVTLVAVVAARIAAGPDTGFDWRTDNAAVLGLAPHPVARRGAERETVADVIDLLQWELELAPA